ncbi:lipopolysaccharide biosynthesis protein [Chryseobacterium vrystaatense]|uniref:Membrane protein involved in the export of O-antigen and teichoic acid n=1 Tax=Chryseobacterium vrystaatense TaxID=307480 RepID=A0A1M5A845_9FLAO|nr:lipopolysaccharide biosynthesis protein [Chryseobacterium vrystaatense]KFF27091.1 polysaccharide biosynthesis protein [Chryseobacterium vrystaatense]SHF26206.1 Membrane protein involved in the export of O-antigen and teichoic acid [Chryseobacterium vrystaatense]
MSVVARQGFKYSIIGYIGFLLGTISAIFIFPYNFEFYGKLRYILPTAEMLVPFVVLGISYSNVKFFQKVEKDGKKQNMLSLSLLMVFINFIIFTGVFFILPYFFPKFQHTEAWKLKEMILPLILILSFCAIFNKYTSNYKRIVVSNIFDNLFPKIANLGAFCLSAYFMFSQQTAFAFFFGIFALMLCGYIYYTNKLEKIQPDFNTDYFKKDNFWKEFFNYSFFGFLGTFGNYLAINSFMIGEFMGMEEVGIYSVLYALISLISVPQLGLFNISAPIISKTLAEGNMEELDRFHKKTSLSLYFLGAVLFSCIMVGFPYLTEFMPKNGTMLREYEPVVWIWGSAVLIDLATGFNGNIISLSKYYRFNILIMLLLAGLTVGLNYYFIKNTDLKLIGIALSTAISLTTYNVIKIAFNYFVFKVSPLTIEMIFVSIICTLAITVAIVLPNFSNNLINLFYKPAVVLILIYIGNHFTKVFPLEDYLNAKFFKSILKFK